MPGLMDQPGDDGSGHPTYGPRLLNNGLSIPAVGLGVYKVPPADTEEVVASALQCGYRHIDTASVYRNEAAVGRAIRASGIPRDQIWVTTKFFPAEGHGYDQVIKACNQSLEQIGLEYIDMYLMHTPGDKKMQLDPARHDSWRAMEALLKDGKVRAIGVSNFGLKHLEALLVRCTVTPAVNQVELSPFLPRQPLVQWCKEKGIVMQAYSPLTKGQRLDHPVLAAMGTPAQVLLRWGLQQGFVVLPKSTNAARQRLNLEALDCPRLSPGEMAELDSLDCGLVTGWDPTELVQLEVWNQKDKDKSKDKSKDKETPKAAAVPTEVYGKEWLQAAKVGNRSELERLLALNPGLLEYRGQGISLGFVGHSALHWAASKGHIEVVRWLLQQGAPVDMQNNGGSRPVHTAASNGQHEVLQVLMDGGADLSLPDSSGQSVWDVAEDFNKYKCLDTLEARIDALVDVFHQTQPEEWGDLEMRVALVLSDTCKPLEVQDLDRAGREAKTQVLLVEHAEAKRQEAEEEAREAAEEAERARAKLQQAVQGAVVAVRVNVHPSTAAVQVAMAVSAAKPKNGGGKLSEGLSIGKVHVADADDIQASTLEAFQRDGVVCLRGGLPSSSIDRMLPAIEKRYKLCTRQRLLSKLGAVDKAADFYNSMGKDGGWVDKFMYLQDQDFHHCAVDTPLPRLCAKLMASGCVNLLYDHLIVKEPGHTSPTNWHVDMPYWPIVGDHVISCWAAFDTVTQVNGGMQFVQGSHRWVPGTPKENCQVLMAPDMQPGDCLCFHGNLLHYASGNRSENMRRRALSLRYAGENCRFAPNKNGLKWPFEPPLKEGDKLTCDLFPLVYAVEADITEEDI